VAAIKVGGERFAADLEPIVADIMRTGTTSLRTVATEMNQRGIVTRRGGAWHPATVRDLIERLRAA